jgi:hypothetical protein
MTTTDADLCVTDDAKDNTEVVVIAVVAEDYTGFEKRTVFWSSALESVTACEKIKPNALLLLLLLMLLSEVSIRCN